MTVVINHTGKKGNRGRDGINGTGFDSLNYDKIKTPLARIIGGEFLSVSRDGEAIFTGRYGQESPIAGDTITHILRRVDDSFDANAVSGLFPLNFAVIRNSSSVSSPLGTANAYEAVFPDTTGDFPVGALAGDIAQGANKIYRVSFWAKIVSGEVSSFQLNFGALTSVRLNEQPNSEWKRFSATISSSNISSLFGFTPITTGCTLHLFGFNITEGVGLYPYSEGSDIIPREVANETGSARINKRGLLIEAEKTNLCRHSQSLDQWQLTGVSDAGVITNQSASFFNGASALLTFSESTIITATRDDLAITQGEQYSVSFYAVILSGAVESLSVSLGDGEAENITPTSSYTRQVFTLTAGQLETINFTATSSQGGSELVIVGVQVEPGTPSSYIPTGNAINSRNAESALIAGNALSSIKSPFTICMSVSDVVTNEQNYLFNIDDELFSYIEDGELYVNGVSVGRVGLSQQASLAFVYDGVLVKAYNDGELIGSTSFTPAVAKPSFFYLGASNELGANALNGFIKTFDWYDTILTSSEIKTAGVYL